MFAILDSKSTQWLLFIVAITCAMLFDAGDVLANTETCTDDPHMVSNSAAGQGIVSAVMQTIIGLLNNTSQALYDLSLIHI